MRRGGRGGSESPRKRSGLRRTFPVLETKSGENIRGAYFSFCPVGGGAKIWGSGLLGEKYDDK